MSDLPPLASHYDDQMLHYHALALLVCALIAGCERPMAGIEPIILTDSAAPLTGQSLSEFGRLIGDARMVALGESRHDTKEQFEARASLSRTLIEQLGFRTLILEESFSHCLALDEFVTSGEGEIRSVLNELAGWYLWDTEEMVEFVNWVRLFNETLPRDQMVRIFGMDITAPALGISRVVQVADELDPAKGWATREYGLDLHAGDRWPQTMRRYSSLSQEDANTIAQNLDALNVFTSDLVRTSIDSKSGGDSQLLAIQADIGKRGHAMFSASGIAEIGAIREEGMANVVEWITNQRDQETRTIVWTHNLHAAKSSFQMPQMAEGDFFPMGVLLAEMLGEDYVAIGASFGTGHYSADLPPGERSFPRLGAETVDGATAELGRDRILLSFRNLDASSAVSRWLSPDREWRMQDAVAILSPGKSFDAIYYVDEITRARPTPMALRKFRENPLR